MALRRSTKKLTLKRRSRRKRGGGIYMPTAVAKPRLYDLEYRQMTEDYRDGIISFEEYISFLQNKLAGLTEGTHDYFTIKKRIKDVTNAYNKKLEKEYKEKANLEYRQITEDYKDGLIGYAVYSEYLTERLKTLDPDSLEYFTTQKKLDDITEQHINKQMDFGFKVAKTIEPDDYIRFKEDLLRNIDPDSNEYLEIQKDIQNAQWEKVRRAELKIKFDINQQTANKMDLAKFYLDIAQSAEDPEKQILYYNRYVSTMDSINREALAEYNKQVALEDRDMLLKYKRGDLGDSFDENLEVYYNYLNRRLETEADVNKQFTLIGRIDSLVKEAQEYEKQKEKISEANAKKIRQAREKEVREKYSEVKNNYFEQKTILEKRLNAGDINAEKYAVEMIKLTDDYIKELSNLAYSPYLTESVWEKIDNALKGVQEHFETDGFWKANIPIRDDKGNFTGRIFSDPNFKAIQKIDKAGNFKTSWEFDPTQSYQKEGYVYDPDMGVWREITERTITNERGEKIKVKEIYRQDENGNVIVEYQDPKTKQWGMLNETGEFIPSQKRYRDVDFKLMSSEDIQKYQQKIKEDVWKEVAQEEGKFGKMKLTVGRYMLDRPEGIIGKGLNIGADVGEKIQKAVDIIKTTSPKEFLREKIAEVPKPSDTVAKIIKSKFKIGDRGKAVEELQKDLKAIGAYRKGITGYVGPKTIEAIQKVKSQFKEDFSKEKMAQLPKDIKTIGRAIGTAAKKIFQPSQIGGALGAVYARRPDLQKVFTATGQGIGQWKGKTIEDWARMYGYKEEPTLKSYAPRQGIFKRITSTAVSKIKGLFGGNKISGALGQIYARRPDLQKVFTATGQGIGQWKGKTIEDWARMYGYKEEPSLRGYAPKRKLTTPFSPAIPAAKKFISYTKKTYTPKTFKRLPSDVGVIKKAVSGKVSNYFERAKSQAKRFLGRLKFW